VQLLLLLLGQGAGVRVAACRGPKAFADQCWRAATSLKAAADVALSRDTRRAKHATRDDPAEVAPDVAAEVDADVAADVALSRAPRTSSRMEDSRGALESTRGHTTAVPTRRASAPQAGVGARHQKRTFAPPGLG